MTALLTMAAQMAGCSVVVALGAFGAVWAMFRAADWLEEWGRK